MSELQADLNCRLSNQFELNMSIQISGSGTTAIYGPSGCGKTTLLYCLAGLLKAGKGSSIRFGETTWQDEHAFYAPEQRKIGYVFQDARLFPHLTVAGNLEFALKRQHNQQGPSIQAACDWLGINALLQQFPSQLSAGQQQRVAIARALLSHPDLLLMDEPLANLDDKSKQQIIEHLRDLQKSLDIPIIYVSHDMAEIAELADQLIVMDNGSLVAQGDLLSLSSELGLPMAQEEGAAAILTAQVTGHDDEFGLAELNMEEHRLYVASSRLEEGESMRLRIPARDVSLCLSPPKDTSILNILPVRVLEIEGGNDNRQLLKLQVGSQQILARLTRKSIVALGLEVGSNAFAQIKTVALLHD